ncbi:MAG: putative glycolipid-binding domain-containing protein [Chloroflexota bacterium]
MKRDVMWTPVKEPGFEYLRLIQDDDGILADAWVIGIDNNAAPFRVSYKIRCDVTWVVRECSVEVINGASLVLQRDDAGHWKTLSSDFDGCIDVDISVTPFTNTLPIQRLALQTGEARETTVVMIRIPDLSLTPVVQRYTRLNDITYRYENLTKPYTAELIVDSDDLVIDYKGVFKRA